jgi:hypothetical protein
MALTPRTIPCPVTEAQCAEPDCSRSRCRERERELQDALDRRALIARREWEQQAVQREVTVDRRRAALRAAQEIIGEMNIERAANAERPLVLPRGKGSRKETERIIARVLRAPEYAGYVERHLEAVLATRTGRRR